MVEGKKKFYYVVAAYQPIEGEKEGSKQRAEELCKELKATGYRAQVVARLMTPREMRELKGLAQP